MLEDILPFILNTEWSLSANWLLRYLGKQSNWIRKKIEKSVFGQMIQIYQITYWGHLIFKMTRTISCIYRYKDRLSSLLFHRYPDTDTDTDTLLKIHTDTDTDTQNSNRYRYQIPIPKIHTDTDTRYRYLAWNSYRYRYRYWKNPPIPEVIPIPIPIP